MSDTLITTTELAKRLGVSTARIRQLAAQNRITGAHQYGRNWLFTPGARIIDAPRTKRLKEKARNKGQRWDPKQRRYTER